MVKVLGLGDNVCDVYLHTETMYPGGQALNFSANAKMMGAESDFMGVFGRDAVADHIKSVLKELGIGFSHCRDYEGENGFARVTLVDGDRVFKGSNKGGVIQNHPIYLDEEDLQYAAGFDHIHTSNNGFTDGLLPALHQLPATVSYDFSYRWNEEDRVDRVCPYVDFAFLSCSDLDEKETQQLCMHLYEKGCRVITATSGGEGATVYDGERFYRQRPNLVKAIDTMGAGDSFATAMLITILDTIKGEKREFWSDSSFRKETIEKALSAASERAAGTCLVNGGFGYGVRVPESVRERIWNFS